MVFSDQCIFAVIVSLFSSIVSFKSWATTFSEASKWRCNSPNDVKVLSDRVDSSTLLVATGRASFGAVDNAVKLSKCAHKSEQHDGS